MRDMTGLYAAREALSTHATALNTVADNLANLNTPGFKTERVEFGDLLAESIGCMMGSPLQTGNGSMARDISTAHSIQGTIEATDRELDAGIQGIGFFVLSDGVSQYYSRAGNFVTDAEGNLRAQSGEFVMGYTPQSPDTLVPLNLTTTASAATPTTLVTLNGNLDSSTPAQENPPNTSNWVDLNNGTAFRTTVQVVDSLGERHDISLHFFKTGNLTWTAQAFVDGAATGGTEDTPVPVSGTGTAITFNGQGLQADGAAATLNVNVPWGNGAAQSQIAIDLSSFTGFVSASAVSSVSSDGNMAGNISGYDIRDDGALVALLDNGENITVGTIALATFRAPNELNRMGDTRFAETLDSGAPTIGAPGQSNRGTLAGKALESSLTDPASEFISLIRFQRGYQANSQVITTFSQILNTTIEIL